MSPPAPPYFSGNGIPSRPSSASPRTIAYGNAPVPVELLGDRGDLAHRELADGALDEAVMVREAEVHALFIPNRRYNFAMADPTTWLSDPGMPADGDDALSRWERQDESTRS